MQLNSLDDCLKLQADLINFYKWSQELGLTLNLDKCPTMSFTRKHFVIMLSYELNNIEILRVGIIIDLGFKFNNTLDPDSQINMICCKAYKMLRVHKKINT